MKRLTLSALLIAGLLPLTGCAVQEDRSAASFEDVSDSTSVGGFLGTCQQEFGVRNELKNWWDGGSIPVTWEISQTKGDEWDGNSRPDNAPPQGLQGLTQNAGDGSYRARLEMDTYCESNAIKSKDAAVFHIRPVINIDGQRIPLADLPIWRYYIEPWKNARLHPYRIVNNDMVGLACKETNVWSEKTPRGMMYYEFVLDECKGKGPTLVIRNYSR